jgi:hypothetical protein
MWIVTVLLLLAAGILGASNLIISKKPNAKELIDKLTPFAGIIGIVLLIWGIFDLYHVLRLTSYIGNAPIYWTIFLITALVELGLGFLLGYGLISKYVLSKNAEAAAKGEQVRAKLAIYQIPMGVTAIVISILYLILALKYA